MKRFFEKWLSSILIVITLLMITFLNTRASENSVNELKAVVIENATMIWENGRQISQLTGYLKGKSEKVQK